MNWPYTVFSADRAALRDMLPVVIVITVFQLLIVRHPISPVHQVTVGFAYVIPYKI